MDRLVHTKQLLNILCIVKICVLIYIHNLCVRAAMIPASLRMSGSCVEMMEFSGSMNGDIYLRFCQSCIVCNF